MNRISLVLIWILLCASCVPQTEIELVAQSGDLTAHVTINKFEFSLQDEYTKMFGTVEITNSSAIAQKYSHKWLWLSSGDEFRSRAYQDSLASNIIDVGTVDVEPNTTLKLSVYWVFPNSEKSELGDDAFVLTINSAGVE